MESGANAHSDTLALAVLDLNVVLTDIRDELSNLHEESQNGRAAVEALEGEVRMVRKVLEEVREALRPLHHLSTISEHLGILIHERG
jgi:predicted  nucleic acid-binding Zn-ribbon protein